MLDRYHAESSSPTNDISWTRSAAALISIPDLHAAHSMNDLRQSIPLPRAKVATIQRHPTSTMFQCRRSLLPTAADQQRPVSDYSQNFQFNVPSRDTFRPNKVTDEQQL
jgi:hypothetical protein